MENSNQPDPRRSRTFRLPESINGKLDELSTALGENNTEVLIRAVNYLYKDKIKVVTEVSQQRFGGLKR